MSDKAKLVAALYDAGIMLEVLEPKSFRSRAYLNASRLLEDSPYTLSELAQDKKALEIKGIGNSLFAQIVGFYATGSLPIRSELDQLWPEGLWEVLRVPGFGPKKVSALHHELGISSLAELEYACNENRLMTLHGFGQKTQEKALESIARLKAQRGKRLSADVEELVLSIQTELSGVAGVSTVTAVGDYRRLLPVTDGLSFVVSGPRVTTISFPDWLAAEQSGRLAGAIGAEAYFGEREGVRVEVLVCPEASLGTALGWHTGSTEYLEAIEARFDLVAASEEEYFTGLGVRLLPPHRRELELANEDAATPLLTLADIPGALHVHSTYSDGSASIYDLAVAAKAVGFSYLGIADHSQTAVYARGLSIERLQEQWEEIARLNRLPEFAGLRILRGIESDILADGSLDYPDEILAQFDFVVASVHSQFRMSYEDMTARLVRAAENPYVDIIGHLTGRILLGRPGYDFNFEAVLAACATHGTALELNSNPHRMDIGWRQCIAARQAGVKIAINPDAHHPEHLTHVRYGLNIANKAGLRREDLFEIRP
jgi:DNA polymerase (family X)